MANACFFSASRLENYVATGDDQYGMTAQRDNASQMRTYHEAVLHELVQRCEPKHIHIPGDKDLPDCVR